jgi:polysaccharide biosynthesis/export protein
VVRKLPNDSRTQTMRVRYNELLRGEALDTNVVVKPGDTIVVP